MADQDTADGDNCPPLPMQTSSQLIHDGLDIEHCRGGKISSSDDPSPPFKKMKLIEHNNIPEDQLSCPDTIDDHDAPDSQTNGDNCLSFSIQSASQVISGELQNKYCGSEKFSSQDNLLQPTKNIKPTENENMSENIFSHQDHIDNRSLSPDSNDDTESLYFDEKFNQSHIKLEFDILDEFNSDDDPDEDTEMNGICSDSDDEDEEILQEEIDAMLDESLETRRNCPRPENRQADDLSHEEKEKIILKSRGRDHFDMLPEGWIEVTHNSGMPVYLHKQTRVCSMSKPYFLGPGSARKHEIPISAIPCLHYIKEIEKEKQMLQETVDPATNNNVDASEKQIPSAKVECVEDLKKEGSLDFMQVREYCMKRFEFQTLKIKRFKTWSGRRKHIKLQKQSQRPTLPENTRLITCPLPALDDKGQSSGNNVKREFIMNPVGKSAVCILHEYVQHTLRVQPRYVFKELENASTPYGAVVVINDMEFGSGYGSSKKQAKSEAAKSALDILIPNMNLDGQGEHEFQDVEFFDQIRVEDPRVCELCMKAGQPYPYQILLECLKRNYGMGNTDINFDMHNLKHQKNEFKMTVGKHTATVICKNKRDGKQRASQAILQLLHPQIHRWGSLLRMYGIGSRQTMKEKKIEEQRITELQSKACANKPNLSILNKLKEEMLKYREMKEQLKPIGKLIPEKMQFVSTSDSNLKNVEL